MAAQPIPAGFHAVTAHLIDMAPAEMERRFHEFLRQQRAGADPE